MSTDAPLLLDTRGLRCPEPIMMLHAKVRSAQSSACIQLLATDPSTLRDVPKFCQFLGHRLRDQQQNGDCYEFLIEVVKA